MIYVAVVVTVFLLPFPFILAFLKIDLFFLIQRVFFNTNASIHLNNLNVELILRVALSCIYFSVLGKLLIITLYIFGLILQHFRNYCHTINQMEAQLENNLLLKFYFRILVFIRHTEVLISDLMMYFVTCGQILLTLMALMVVNCKNILPPFILAGFASVFVGGLILSIIILRLASHAQVYITELVEKK